ncbi:unnamed protein product, partial [Laminaria digitata]
NEQAISNIHAWGSRSSSSSGSSGSASNSERNTNNDDPWHVYQTKLLPELQTVARKHGRGLTPADVATAFHLYSKPIPSDVPRATAAAVTDNAVAAVMVPVRVNSGGSLSTRRAVAKEEERVAGRRGAELAAMLDREDLERIAMAVEQGTVVRREGGGPAAQLGWEQALLGEKGGGEEEEGDEGDRGHAEGLWEGATLFL